MPSDYQGLGQGCTISAFAPKLLTTVSQFASSPFPKAPRVCGVASASWATNQDPGCRRRRHCAAAVSCFDAMPLASYPSFLVRLLTSPGRHRKKFKVEREHAATSLGWHVSLAGRQHAASHVTLTGDVLISTQK